MFRPVKGERGLESQPAPWQLTEKAVIDLVVLLLCWGLVALLLAVLSLFSGWAALVIGVALWLIIRRSLPRFGNPLDKWWGLAIGLALSVAVVNSLFPGEQLLTGRDSGTYLATAGWLAQDGSLLVDATNTSFSAYEDLSIAVPGFYDIGGDGVLEPQFMHMYPAMLGSLIDTVGLSAALRLNAAGGSLLLLLIFGLGRRFMSPSFGLLACVILATSFVFTYFTRSPFAEPLTAVFVTAGVWTLSVAEERSDPRFAWLAGILLGAATLVRLDGIVVLVPTVLYLMVASHSRPSSRGLFRRVRIGMFAAALLGLLESLIISPAYVLQQSSQVVAVLAALLVVIVAGDLLAGRVTRVGAFAAGHKRTVVTITVSLAAVGLAYGAFIRPLVVESRGAPYGIERLQEREGVQQDETRNYAENSVRWIAWYQGWPFVFLAFIGVMVAFRRRLLRAGTSPPWLLLVLFIAFAVLYLWRPSINPDHVWVMRRYLPVVLPFGSLIAAFGAQWLATRGGEVQKSVPFARSLLGGAIALALIVPPVLTTLPVWNVAELKGLAADFSAACTTLGPNAHVLLLEQELGSALTQSFRSYCGRPSAAGGSTLSTREMDNLRRNIEAEGGRLVLLASGREEGLKRILDGPYSYFEITLLRPPSSTLLIDPVLSLLAS